MKELREVTNDVRFCDILESIVELINRDWHYAHHHDARKS